MTFFEDSANFLAKVEMCKSLAARAGHAVSSTTRAHIGETLINAATSLISEKMSVESAIAKKIILQHLSSPINEKLF